MSERSALVSQCFGRRSTATFQRRHRASPHTTNYTPADNSIKRRPVAATARQRTEFNHWNGSIRFFFFFLNLARQFQNILFRFFFRVEETRPNFFVFCLRLWQVDRNYKISEIIILKEHTRSWWVGLWVVKHNHVYPPCNIVSCAFFLFVCVQDGRFLDPDGMPGPYSWNKTIKAKGPHTAIKWNQWGS